MNPTQHEELWTHREAIINGVRLHYVEAGKSAKTSHLNPQPLVILLHGFPEFWYSWRHQITALANAGYHVIAPDMRGYNTSEKPCGIHNYRIDALTDDVAALIRYSGAERAVVVGHDWGGVVAWFMPMLHKATVEKLIILNAPHPVAWLRDVRKPSQLAKSWYTFFFQLPWLPEQSIRANNYALLRNILRFDPVRRKSFSKQDISRYVEAAAQPGALTAAINYYRAAFRLGPQWMLRKARPIEIPTLLIWGERDRYLETSMTQDLENWVPQLRVDRLPQASHWVQNDAPEEVNQLMLRFLQA